MKRTILATLVAITFLATSLFAQAPASTTKEKKEKPKTEIKKEAPKKEQMVLKSVSCAPECGFMVRSHNEAEVTSIIKEHAKKAHNKDLTDEQIKKMMKTEKQKK